MLETTDWIVVGLRALAFIAILQAAGNSLYACVFESQLTRSARLIWKLTAVIGISAVLLTVVQHVLEPARMTVSFSGVWDGSLQAILLQSDAGAARTVRVLGLVLVTWGAVSESTRATGSHVSLIGGVIALSSFALMGHTATSPERWILAVFLLIHLLIAAFWFGALLAFLVSARSEQAETLGELIERFSSVGVWLVPIIPIVGIVMAILLIPDLSSLASPYGTLLILKVGGFAVLMAFAVWNKFRLGPAIGGGDTRAVVTFRKVVAAEWVVIALVLVATAFMTGLYGPE